jgi:hypothetical protein
MIHGHDTALSMISDGAEGKWRNGCDPVQAAGPSLDARSTHLGGSQVTADHRWVGQRNYDNSFSRISGSTFRPQQPNGRPDQADLGLVLGGIPGQEDLNVIVRYISIHSPPPLDDSMTSARFQRDPRLPSLRTGGPYSRLSAETFLPSSASTATSSSAAPDLRRKGATIPRPHPFPRLWMGPRASERNRGGQDRNPASARRTESTGTHR